MYCKHMIHGWYGILQSFTKLNFTNLPFQISWLAQQWQDWLEGCATGNSQLSLGTSNSEVGLSTAASAFLEIQQMILAISLGDLFGWSHPQQHFKSYIRLRFGCAYSKVQCLQLLFKKYAQGENGWSKVSNCPPARCRFLPKRSEADEMDVQGAILPEETQENLRRGWCEWSANCVLLFISDQSWWVTQFSTNPPIFTISLYRSLCYRLYPIYYT